MKKILASVALFALLAFALTFATACGSDDPAPAPQPGQAATQPGQQPVTPPPAVPGQPTETPAADLPEIELTIHYHVGHSFFRDDWPAWQQIMAATNVRLVGTANPVATDGGEQFNLEAASLFPAHIYGGQHLATLFMEFGMQGAFVPLNDLIANYAPHFNAILEANPMIRAAITAPDGNIYHLPTLPDGLQEGARAWFIRQDWLDLLGRDIPQTVEELEETLIAFRDEIPPLIGVDYVWPYIDGNWHNVLRLANLWGARAFGHDNHAIRVSFREGSNEIYHTWTDPQFMVALQNISRWYGMGLIDQDFIGRGGGARSQLLSQNQAGVFFDFPVSSAAFNDSAAILAEIPDFQLVAFQPPANIFGQRISEHERLLVQPHGWAISHTNPDPVRTMMFMDYFYSQHGRNLLSFGGEGVSWEYDADGNPVFLPITFDHPGQANPTEFIRHEQGGLRFIGYMQNFEYERQLATPAAREAFAINYGGPFAVRQVPTVGFTEAELQTINTIRPVLQTYLNEQIQSMILGDWTLIEGQWDAFVAGAVSIGRDDYVAAWQSAVNRALGN